MVRSILMGVFLLLFMKHFAYTQEFTVADQLKLHWSPSEIYNGTDNLELVLVVKNISNHKLKLQEWELWFNSMYPILDKKTDQYAFTNQNGNLFKLAFFGDELLPNDSLVTRYVSKYAISNVSTIPNGFYLQDKRDYKSYYSIKNFTYTPIKLEVEKQNDFNHTLFERNKRLNKKAAVSAIFPTPKSIVVNEERYFVPSTLRFYVSPDFNFKFDFLSENSVVKRLRLIPSEEKEANLVIKKVKGLKDEAYKLSVTGSGITIESSSYGGVIYAVQSLFSLLSPAMYFGEAAIEIPHVLVDDEPRYSYRGFMMDIARNFKDKCTILKYLDLMARYKLNVFHFHFIDDEGWRIEMPSFPELTKIGANRSPLFSDGNSLQPAYGSGGRSTAGDFLSRADFIEILKYAHERNITVVPEIETPGHARASIKAMHARYNRLMKEGKKKEAEMYLLNDLEDKSVYSSVQYFTDNVINPALPSTYAFIGRVVDDFIAMYNEAGIPLSKISIGGDEVPKGVWTESPLIEKLMKKEGMRSVHEVWIYYIQKVNEIFVEKGLNMAGWEEIGMVNKGNGMVVNPDLINKSNVQVDVWNNVIGAGQEDLAYRLANEGYKTVLISASNMYFDMMWNTNFMEPGLKWATYADFFHAYSLFPEDFFANIDYYYSGGKLGKEAFKNRVRLTENGRLNFLGIKGGLWAETVLCKDQMDYLVFPRLFALAERAWSAKREYESESKFNIDSLEKDYAQFINRIGKHELPKLAGHVKFRLPAVGIKEIEGNILANTEYPGFSIYYTQDSTTPSLNSSKYSPTARIRYNNGEVLTFAVVDADGRVGPVSIFKK